MSGLVWSGQFVCTSLQFNWSHMKPIRPCGARLISLSESLMRGERSNLDSPSERSLFATRKNHPSDRFRSNSARNHGQSCFRWRQSWRKVSNHFFTKFGVRKLVCTYCIICRCVYLVPENDFVVFSIVMIKRWLGDLDSMTSRMTVRHAPLLVKFQQVSTVSIGKWQFKSWWTLVDQK